MFVKTLILAAAAGSYFKAVVAAPTSHAGRAYVDPFAGLPIGKATAPPTGDDTAPPFAPPAGNQGQECTETNRINCDNVGGTHDNKVIGQPSGSGGGCIDCGNVGGTHGNTIINGGGPVTGVINAGPGDCIDCGHVGGNFGDTVVLGPDAA